MEISNETERLLRMASDFNLDGVNMDAVKTVLTEIGEKAVLVVVLDEFDTLSDTVGNRLPT